MMISSRRLRAVPFRGAARVRRASLAIAVCGGLLTTMMASGCVPPEILSLRGSLDSLRAVVDTMTVRDSIAMVVLQDTRRDVADQRDILLSTRATAGSTTQEMMDQMEQLQGKLDEVMGRFQRVTERAPVDVPSGGDSGAQQIYDQAALDLAQGRYDIALEGFRTFVSRFPSTELSDNAQYGIGECQFAQSRYDSAAVEYAKVESLYPQGEKVPAGLYKLALSLEKLGRTEETQSTLESLIERYPLSGEAQLARERLGKTERR